MVDTWKCKRCLVTHRIDPTRVRMARNGSGMFRCERPDCSVVYVDRAQSGKPELVRLYIELVPAYG